MNFIEQQSQNKKRTFILVFLFFILLMTLGLGLDLIVFNRDFLVTHQWNGTLPVFTILAVIIAMIQTTSAYFYGDKIVLRSTNAREIKGGSGKPFDSAQGKTFDKAQDKPFDKAQDKPFDSAQDKLEQQLINVVDEVTIAAGIPCPKIYIVPDNDLNAFATGRDPEHASLAVTQGLLEKLNREELQAVVAHEVGHIRNYDTRLMMVLAVLLGAVLIFHTFAARGRILRIKSSSREKGGGGLLIIVWLITAILAPFIAQILTMAVSRQREYYADATSVELTRNPQGLIGALKKISDAIQPTPSIKEGYAHMCIDDPKGREINQSSGLFSDLLASHPPLQKRIEALEKISYMKS